MQDDYLTIPELAARWKISVPTVRRKLARGELAKVYIGRVVRIERSEVERIEAAWKGRAGTDTTMKRPNEVTS